MASLARPRGLIDYESWNNIERGRRGEARVSRLVRPKTVLLTASCVAMAAGMTIMFANRTSGSISVQHDRSPVAVVLSDGSVRNGYTIKLLNKSAMPRAFELRAEGPDVTMAIVGAGPGRAVTVPADGSEALRVALTMARPQNADVRFVARDAAARKCCRRLTGSLSGSGPILLRTVLLGWRTKILRAADAFYARRRKGPYCFIQNRSPTSVAGQRRPSTAGLPEGDLQHALREERHD